MVIYSKNCLEYMVMTYATLRLGGKFAGVNHLLIAGMCLGILMKYYHDSTMQWYFSLMFV